jgi:hypothetical protein
MGAAAKYPVPESWLIADSPHPDKELQADQSSQQPVSLNASGIRLSSITINLKRKIPAIPLF